MFAYAPLPRRKGAFPIDKAPQTVVIQTAGHRTFRRRQRHKCVGDFSAQCLNGRRQAMIFRLRGVALFGARSSVRGVPAGRKWDERPGRIVVVGGLRRLLRSSDDWRGRHHSQREAQTCTLQIHCCSPAKSTASKRPTACKVRYENHRAPKRRARSQIRFSLQKHAPAFNGSRQSVPRSKVDRLG